MQQNWKSKLNLLVSYAFLRGTDQVLLQLVKSTAPFVSWLVDCGAYSNYQSRLKSALGKPSKDKPITIEEYIDACKKHFHGVVWQYIMLDVVRKPDETERNLQAMLDAGLQPMPVYIESWSTPEKMQQLCAVNQRICVAGGVFSNDHYIRKRYIDAFEASAGQARIHALGFGRWPDVFQLPIASCDSSTFTTGERFGKLLRYSRKTGFKNLPWLELSNRADQKAAPERREYIRFLLDDCQVPARVLSNAAYYRGSANIPGLTQVFGYLQFSQHCQERQLDYFLALSTKQWCSNIFGVLAHSNADGFDYMQARQHVLQLVELQNNAPEKWIAEIVRIAKEHSEWETRESK